MADFDAHGNYRYFNVMTQAEIDRHERYEIDRQRRLDAQHAPGGPGPLGTEDQYVEIAGNILDEFVTIMETIIQNDPNRRGVGSMRYWIENFTTRPVFARSFPTPGARWPSPHRDVLRMIKIMLYRGDNYNDILEAFQRYLLNDVRGGTDTFHTTRVLDYSLNIREEKEAAARATFLRLLKPLVKPRLYRDPDGLMVPGVREHFLATAAEAGLPTTEYPSEHVYPSDDLYTQRLFGDLDGNWEDDGGDESANASWGGDWGGDGGGRIKNKRTKRRNTRKKKLRKSRKSIRSRKSRKSRRSRRLRN